MRLIDADALKEELDSVLNWNTNNEYNMYSDTMVAIDNAPTIEAEPVLHGRWIDKYGNGDLYCSECGAVMEKHEHINHNLYFCYHCGANMDIEEEYNENR